MSAKPLALYYSVLDFQPEVLAALSERYALVILPDPTHDTPELLEAATIVFAPMGFLLDRDKLARCTRLKAIGSPTTGLPHIDVEYALSRGVRICSLRDQQDFLADITPTAELAWGMLIALVRRLPWAHASVLEGRWEGKTFGRRTPRMLSSMRLGVIGLGRLGTMVARYGAAFGMTVRGYDPYRVGEGVEMCATLHGLAAASDVVSIHVHSTPETRGMIDAAFFAAMPAGSFFVNTARGDLVDETALLAALETGHLAGAALDTLSGEHLPGFAARAAAHPLLQYGRTHDNLLVTPHYGGSTRDSWVQTEMRILALIDDALLAQV